jgi:gliding motility-associated-like protein
MRKAAIICCVLATMMASYAQNPQFKWVTGFGSQGAVIAMKIITDANGNLYTLGFFTGTHDFDPGAGVYDLTSNGATDIFLIKSDPGGNFQWAKSWGASQDDYGITIFQDVNGNIYISGNFHQSIDLDPGSGSDNRAAQSYQDMFICKLDASGNFVWGVTIPGTPIESGNFLATDGLGNVYMSGNFEGMVDFDPGYGTATLTADGVDVFIVKLDASGNFQWVKQINSPLFDYVYDIAVDNAGNVFTTGSFQNTIDFDPGAGTHLVTSKGSRDAYILKLDANGNFQWVVQIGSTGLDDAINLEVDNLGNVYSSGYFSGTADFDPGAGVINLTSDGSYYSFIMKLDASGNLVWAIKLGGNLSTISDLEINNSGDVFITGTFAGTIDFDPAKATDDLSAVNEDMYVAKFSTDGVFEWSGKVTGPGLNYGHGLAVDEYDNVFITGVFSGTADFDPGAGVHELTSPGLSDSYILKIGVCAFTTASSIIETTCKSFTLNDKIYTTSGTYIQTMLNAAGCDSTITLNLTVTGTISTTIAKSICEGESFEGYTSAGSYTDSYTTLNGCDSIRTLSLSVVNKPSPSLGEDMLLCKGDSISLYPGSFDAYTWQDGSRLDRLLVKDAGMYSVMVETACGVASDQIIVRYGPCGVYFPSAFSPNRDGLNDEFRTITNTDFFSSYHLIIFNRWGQKIFESKDPSRGWDGKVNGTLQAAETFVWACNFTVRDKGVKDSKHGTVTLVR